MEVQSYILLRGNPARLTRYVPAGRDSCACWVCSTRIVSVDAMIPSVRFGINCCSTVAWILWGCPVSDFMVITFPSGVWGSGGVVVSEITTSPCLQNFRPFGLFRLPNAGVSSVVRFPFKSTCSLIPFLLFSRGFPFISGIRFPPSFFAKVSGVSVVAEYFGLPVSPLNDGELADSEHTGGTVFGAVSGWWIVVH